MCPCFEARETPACASACVQMQFHVQREEPETAILTVATRVSDGAHQSSYVPSRMRAKALFLDDNQGQQDKYERFSALNPVRTRKAGQTRLHCVFGALFRCARTLTCITAGLHLHVSIRSFMSNDRSGCSAGTVKPWRKSLECFVMPLFVRSTVCSSVLVLKMSSSAATGAHKSWPS